MLDDTKAYYASSWDIDQVLLPDPIELFLSIGASPDGGVTAATATSTYNHALNYLPVIEGQFRSSNQTTWHQCGLPDGFILANWNITSPPPFWPGMIATNGATVAFGFDEQNVYFNALNYNTVSQTLTIRLYMWADKVNY